MKVRNSSDSSIELLQIMTIIRIGSYKKMLRDWLTLSVFDHSRELPSLNYCSKMPSSGKIGRQWMETGRGMWRIGALTICTRRKVKFQARSRSSTFAKLSIQVAHRSNQRCLSMQHKKLKRSHVLGIWIHLPISEPLLLGLRASPLMMSKLWSSEKISMQRSIR